MKNISLNLFSFNNWLNPALFPRLISLVNCNSAIFKDTSIYLSATSYNWISWLMPNLSQLKCNKVCTIEYAIIGLFLK